MSSVQALLKQTEELYDHVKNGLPDESPDEYLEELGRHLETRQKLIEQLTGDYSKDEMEIGQQLVQINESIQPYLDQQMTRIKTQVQQIKMKKTNNTKYSNPYQSARADGMFLDKRK
ncbi:hypothetical protein [Alkalihalobacillus sp. AL-G]|uniref:hypothetical protein n=1 Tax=Alkalihalobacillus sp. AL-G TaxID=2926399 RepID=UPI00272A5DA1|nr:hypothetical protein [Alkalihalobacillus sp. AL-G]WLD92964.1 hypothetical protein MOJ78_18475 [Alkalihalobacillus sp. AL-G]